jgi:hypothetical protein
MVTIFTVSDSRVGASKRVRSVLCFVLSNISVEAKDDFLHRLRFFKGSETHILLQ